MKRSTLSIGVTILTMTVMFFVIVAATSANEKEDKSFPNTLTPSSTMEDQLKWKEEFTQWAKENDAIITLSGEETRGSVIEINGEKIQLPSDAFVKSFIVSDEYLSHKEGYNIHLPYYTIQRGDSIIRIGVNTGYVLDRQLAKGEQKAFDFLEKSIQGVLPEVSSVG